MKTVTNFFRLNIAFLLLIVVLIGHSIYLSNTMPRLTHLTQQTGLIGNAYQNNTLYFRHFEYSDYFSGHFYYPSSPLLESEAFIYKGVLK
ncbi:MAG: hypothetical protein M0P43_01800 [Arcobacteraceae bacterium]|nr:hypothetical protein [Arcobacteraceae bacterium]